MKVRNSLLVEANIPAHHNVVLRLRLLQLLVIVSLQVDQRAKYVLVLVGIFVPAHKETADIHPLSYKHLDPWNPCQVTVAYMEPDVAEPTIN